MRNYFMQLLGNSLVGMFPAKDEWKSGCNGLPTYYVGCFLKDERKSAAATARQELLCGMFPEGRAEERSCNGPPRTIMWDVS
jgi:hypothetical protein